MYLIHNSVGVTHCIMLLFILGNPDGVEKSEFAGPQFHWGLFTGNSYRVQANMISLYLQIFLVLYFSLNSIFVSLQF